MEVGGFDFQGCVALRLFRSPWNPTETVRFSLAMVFMRGFYLKLQINLVLRWILHLICRPALGLKSVPLSFGKHTLQAVPG